MNINHSVILVSTLIGIIYILIKLLFEPIYDELVGDENSSNKFYKYRIIKETMYVDKKLCDVLYILQRCLIIPIYKNIFTDKDLSKVIKMKKKLEDEDRKCKPKIKTKIHKLKNSDFIEIL